MLHMNTSQFTSADLVTDLSIHQLASDSIQRDPGGWQHPLGLLSELSCFGNPLLSNMDHFSIIGVLAYLCPICSWSLCGIGSRKVILNSVDYTRHIAGTIYTLILVEYSLWRWYCEIGDVLGGGQSGGGRSRVRHNGSWDSIYRLTCNSGNVKSRVPQGAPRDEKWVMRCWLGVEDSQFWVDVVIGECCTQCWLILMACRDWEAWLNVGFSYDGRVVDKYVRDEKRLGKTFRNTGA